MVIVVCGRVVDRSCGTTLAKVRLRLERRVAGGTGRRRHSVARNSFREPASMTSVQRACSVAGLTDARWHPPHSSTGRAVGGITALKLTVHCGQLWRGMWPGCRIRPLRDRQRREFLGTAEALLDDASRLAERARKAGVAVSYEPSEDMIHVWHLFVSMLDGGPAGDRPHRRIRAEARGVIARRRAR